MTDGTDLEVLACVPEYGSSQDVSAESIAFGCTFVTLAVHADARGFLVPVWMQCCAPATYLYYSVTHAGMHRDLDLWHIHQNHTDRFVATSGKVMFALSDGRSTRTVIMSGQYPRLLVVPPGVYHAFRVYPGEDAMVLNLPSEIYDPDDEGRVKFTDLDVVRPW